MSSAEVTSQDSGESMTAFRRWMIMAARMCSTTLYAMTILIVSVVLPQMQGSLSATPDQITWVMTFNILATAVVTPVSGWLAGRFGWRNVMLVSQAGFCISTFLCGIAESLEALVFFRILQGGFGAPTIPLAQAIILDIFPRRQHSLVTSIFGMGVVVGPIFGPVLGGYLTELYNWRFAFYMLVPLALVGFVSLWVFLSDGGRQARLRFDWTGFMLLAAALSCLQLVLDRGQQLDWLDSPEILLEIVIGCCALYAFLIHSFMADRPFLDLRLLRDNNYSIGLLIVLIYGMLNFTPMVVMPPMLKELGGYPEAIIGTLLGTRGVGAILGFFLAGRLSRFDPKVVMTLGFSIQALSGVHMMTFDMNVGIADVMVASFMQGASVGLVWVPLVVATFATLERRYLAETTAVFHLLRNVGSSIFISISVTMVIRTGTSNYARMTEFVSPFNEILSFPQYLNFWDTDTTTGLARIAELVSNQADMIGFLNAFGLYTLASVLVLPLIWMVRMPKRDAHGG